VAGGGGGDSSALKKDLAAGRFAAAYLLYGEETFLKEEAVAALRRVVLGEGTPGASQNWNLTVLEGASAGMAEILDAARTLPMLEPRRMVLVRNSERLRETDAQSLRRYLDEPTLTSCLVFVTGEGKPDFRKAIFRALQEAGAAVEFKAVRGRSVQKWIRDRLREIGAEIEEEALALLEVHLGSDLFRIDQEVRKALDYLAPSRRITTKALSETLGGAVAGSVFELAERVGAGETEEAICLLRGILAEGEEPVRLLSLITRQIRILILGKALVKAGRQGRDLASALGIPSVPFVVEKTRNLIARFPEAAGAASLRRILDADRALKRGVGTGPAVLEGLVLDLTAQVSRQRRLEGSRS